MTSISLPTTDEIDSWADDPRGPVALSLTQILVPVEGERGVIFPPTYPDIPDKYNIDDLPGNTKVVTIDSVASQANRMEPMFAQHDGAGIDNPLAALVPQIRIRLGDDNIVSLLDIGHRLADAIVRSTELRDDAKQAFAAYHKSRDAGAIAKISPTSLVFGAWDSRGTYAKVPRIVQSVIRGWDVAKLTRSAIYMPPVDYAAAGVLSEEHKKKDEKTDKSPAAKRGYDIVPDIRAHGGVVVLGEIRRDATVNLVALRRLVDAEGGKTLRRYILGLALVAAAEPQDGFLRQGCLLTPHPDKPSPWITVGRNGDRTPIVLTAETALSYAQIAAQAYGIGPDRDLRFDQDLARADLADTREKKKKPSANGGK